MKINYCLFVAFFATNALIAQQSSNLNTSFLSEKTVIANLNYSILPTTINTDKSNIALGAFKDKFIITSYQRYPHAKVEINRYTKEQIPNILCTEVSYDYDLKYPNLFSRFLKSEFNEGAITFNKNSNEAFLTRKKDLKDVDYYLFKTVLIDTFKGVWSEPTEVLIDNKSIALTNPRLSKNNELMYFSAQLPNGYGGYDIYSANYEDGVLKNLKNLGPEINTIHNELTAVDEGDFLYFSSDMPGGFGGYDIYRVTNKEGTYKYKINIGNKINTANDEINLIPITKSEGYFTSNQNTGENFDIFRYKIKFDKIIIKTIFVDKNNSISNLPVEIIDEDGNLIFEGLTDNNGEVIIETEPFNTLNYSFTSDKYYTDDSLTYEIIDDYPNHYKIILLNEHKSLKAPINKINLKKISEDNTVYFEFDKHNIQDYNIQKIKNIADILHEFPDLYIIVEGHSDKIGKSNYNKKLSQKRIDSVVSLLLNFDIQKDRIIMDARGNTSPYIKCEPCSKEQHALNRRVFFEFIENK